MDINFVFCEMCNKYLMAKDSKKFEIIEFHAVVHCGYKMQFSEELRKGYKKKEVKVEKEDNDKTENVVEKENNDEQENKGEMK